MTASSAEAPFLVLHVCTGNICRSPMAELLMRAELETAYGPAASLVVLDGAGTYHGHVGERINPPAGFALRRYGVDASSFRAQGLTAGAVRTADLVLCATREHVRRVTAMVPPAADRTFTLTDFAAVARTPGLAPVDDPAARLRQLRSGAGEHLPQPSPASDIDDPYGQGEDVYRRTAEQIRDAVRAIVGAPRPTGSDGGAD